jgi:dolichol-phosphate mannosyltransferase
MSDNLEPMQSSLELECCAEVRGTRQWTSVVKRFLATPGGKESRVGLIASLRSVKFFAVGGIGVVVNLATMAVLIQSGFVGDWRTSAVANLVATLHNYLLNNHWTFGDRRKNGRALLHGAFMYFSVAAVGIAISTVFYSILLRAHFRSNFGTSSLYLLGAQLVSIFVGSYFNYALNKSFTWRLEKQS